MLASTGIRPVDHLVVLTLPSGEQIETTEVHPFYVAGRGFIEAGKLGIGTSIVTRAGPALAIAGIERRPGRVRVYNFEVEGFHTYFVGRSGGGVWVHNGIPCDKEPGPYYRGGNNMAARRGSDIIVDKRTGLIRTNRGLSVNTDPGKVLSHGVPHEIDLESLPDELTIGQAKPGTHYEIYAREPMTPERYDELVGRIKLIPRGE